MGGRSAANRATSVGTTYDAQGHVDRMSWQQSGANAFIEPAFDGTLLDSLRTTGETTTQVDFTYDGAFRVEGIDVSAGGTSVAALYEFDLDGLPDAVRLGRGRSSFPGAQKSVELAISPLPVGERH